MLWRYERLPFGLKISTAAFLGRVEHALRQVGCWDFARPFVDDVLVFSTDLASHVSHMTQVLRALQGMGFLVHPAKSIFGADRVEYLGHMIKPGGREPEHAKVGTIAALPLPKDLKQVRAMLGLMGYYRDYVPDFSRIAAPPNELTKKGVPFNMEGAPTAAFEKLRTLLCTPGIALRAPDPNCPFFLHTDWSQKGLGAVLGQHDDEGRKCMVACISRSLNVHEKNYTPWKGELLAAVWAIRTFRTYLHGRNLPFRLVTDHMPLLWLMTASELAGQQARWVLSLHDYDFEIQHRPGSQHVNANVASRFLLPTTRDTTGARLNHEGDPLTMPLPKVHMPDGSIWQPTPVDVPTKDQLDHLVHESPRGAEVMGVAAACSLSGHRVDNTASRVAYAAMVAALTIGGEDGEMGPLSPCLHHHDLLAGNLLGPADRRDHPADGAEAPAAGEAARREGAQRDLAREATAWVDAAAAQGLPRPEVPLQGSTLAPDGTDPATWPWQVDTAPLAHAGMLQAGKEGVVVCELFGGICAGLEMAKARRLQGATLSVLRQQH
jgi:hypothetical protein